MAALYDRLDKNQKEVYDKIVAFGKGKDFSAEDINIALQIAYVESEFGRLKDSGSGAKGLFQYTEIHWVDRQRPGWSQVGKRVKDILSSWGYTRDPKRPEGNKDPDYEEGTVNIFRAKQDDQIAMFYAELKIYADRFRKGVPDPAYNKVCRNIECPTDPYSRKALYIEATHHGPDKIAEVLNGWKNKVQPNLMDNLNYLKKNAAKWDKKASLDDPETPMRLAMDALELTADDVHLTSMEADGGGKTSDTFHIRDNDTSDIIGSCVMTPGGCEIAAGDKKVVMSRLSGSDVHLETYARNDEGDFEFLGMSRIGDNDGVTVRRPFAA